MAVFLAGALGRVERLVDRGDDVRHRDLLRAAREVIAAARTAHAGDQLRAAQLAEQLLQIGKRNVLALADGRQRDRAAILAQRQIDHGGHREPALRRQSHGYLYLSDQYPIAVVKYTLYPSDLIGLN